MDVVGPVLDILTRLWGCIFKDVSSVKEFVDNVKALETGLDHLKNVREDVKRRVELEEERQMFRRKQVDSWLQRVEAIDDQVKDVLENANRKPQRSCCRGCPSWSSYKLGEEVTKKLKVVDELTDEGKKFDYVADMLPRGPVDEKPLEETVGLNLPFQEVQGWMKDNQVKVIGIHGMGGVGKTTLLKLINNQLARTNLGFDIVIWITVSRQSRVEKVQEGICEKLKLPENMWRDKSEDEKETLIHSTLHRKKFVLMLDDIWKRVDLVKVGVPSAQEQEMSKVVFTTRYEGVCGHMEANKKIKINCLEREEALTLFMKKVGTSTLSAHPNFAKLAEEVAEECKGMPLALITVGRAMADKDDLRDWDRVITKLRKEPSRIEGMDEEVYHVLKFSYDSLPNDTIKSCFIYCCLYPEDDAIFVEDVVQLWILEGLLDEFNDIHEARDEGCVIVKTLKAANLLETGESEEYVKMHDVIRDMAWWISSESNAIRNRFVVIDHVDLLKDRFSSRVDVGRISLWGSSIRSIDEDLLCPTALTFLARFTAITMFPAGFSHSMPVLKVLDLSFSFYLEELPPAIDKLVELQLLNLSYTSIRKLPIELRNLAKMKYLLLNATSSLEVIPRAVISNFSCLRVFRLYYNSSSASSDTVEDNVLSGGRISLLEELECLQHINDISITVFDATAVQKLQCSSKIQNCLTSLCFERCEGLTSLEFSSSSVKGMRHLERLDLFKCEVQHLIIHPEAEERREIGTSHGRSFMTHGYFLKLRTVIIAYCDNLLDCAWLIYAQKLELLDVHHCHNMVEIIHDFPYEEDSTIFSRLKELRLFDVPNLHSVYPRSLRFPSLVEISVGGCRSLRRLPFDSSSGKGTLKKIKGAISWWDKLQWDDETLEPYFRSYYVPEEPKVYYSSLL